MEKEIWKDIVGYEGLYQISNAGNVKSLDRINCGGRRVNGRILKSGIDTGGYHYVALSKNGKVKNHTRHRLVAMAFIPNPDNLPEVNHKDEDKEHCYIENLEWCTRKYNANYGTAAARSAANTDFAKRNANIDWRANALKASIPVVQYDKAGKLIRRWDGIKIASRELAIDPSCIVRCCKGRNKTAGGFIWRYAQ